MPVSVPSAMCVRSAVPEVEVASAASAASSAVREVGAGGERGKPGEVAGAARARSPTRRASRRTSRSVGPAAEVDAAIAATSLPGAPARCAAPETPSAAAGTTGRARIAARATSLAGNRAPSYREHALRRAFGVGGAVRLVQRPFEARDVGQVRQVARMRIRGEKIARTSPPYTLRSPPVDGCATHEGVDRRVEERRARELAHDAVGGAERVAIVREDRVAIHRDARVAARAPDPARAAAKRRCRSGSDGIVRLEDGLRGRGFALRAPRTPGCRCPTRSASARGRSARSPRRYSDHTSGATGAPCVSITIGPLAS